jgi:hypothetical protein
MSDCALTDITYTMYLVKGMSSDSHYNQWSSCNHDVNKSTLLSDCSVVEQHAAIKFFVVRGGKIICEGHRGIYIIQRKVYQQVERFQSGRTSVTDEDHLGHLTSLTVDNVEWVNALVQEDSQAYCHRYSRQVGHQLWICIIHHLQGLQMSQNLCKVGIKAAYRWAQTGKCGNVNAIFVVITWRKRGFPTMDCHRQWNSTLLWICKQMSKHWVETCIIVQDQEIQRCAFCWQSDGDSTLGLNGSIFKHYQHHRQTVTSARYCAMLVEELKPAMCSKCRGMLTNVVILHHDNALTHTTAATLKRYGNWNLSFSPT